MKTLLPIFVFTFTSYARVIYGPDNRIEVYQASRPMMNLASSVATMIEKKSLKSIKDDPTQFKLISRRLIDMTEEAPPEEVTDIDPIPEVKPSDENTGGSSLELEPPIDLSDILPVRKLDLKEGDLKFCPDLKYAQQKNPGICTGFLIGPDLVLTAGHCGKIENYCENYRWVFDFKADSKTNDAPELIKAENIYSCKKVINTSLSLKLNMDFNLVQLDRIVTGRSPLKYRTSGTITKDESVTIIGSPNGLPLKIAGGANVRSSAHPLYFSANLDSFQGNSGSPVFNSLTGEIEGILVRGEEDFTPDFKRQCIEINECENGSCRGEDVTKINSIPEIGVQPLYFSLALSGDVVRMGELLKINFWRNIYDQNGVTALMRAASTSSPEMIDLLVSEKLDANLSDIQGNTALHYLVKSKSFSEESMRNLLKAKPNLESKNKQGLTPLLLASKMLKVDAIKNLISSGADKNALAPNGENCLFEFARAAMADEISELAALGVDTSVRNDQNQTVFHILKNLKMKKLASMNRFQIMKF